MVMFEPMFYNELAAMLYAHHWYEVTLGHTDWLRQGSVGQEVKSFIRALYGEEPEEHADYFNVLAEMEHGHHGAITDLWLEFAKWRKNPSVQPSFVLQER